MSFGNIKKKKRLLALLLCTILAGASFMTGCGSKHQLPSEAQRHEPPRFRRKAGW